MVDNLESDSRPANASPWNSLEVMKLLVAVLTPLFIAYIGYQLTTIQSDVIRVKDEQISENKRVREFRLDIYKQAGPLLNDIFAYQAYVGSWKEFTPKLMIEKKRKLDTIMYSHQSLFSHPFFGAYREFMEQAFQSAGGWNTDAKLRTVSKCRKNYTDEPNVVWSSRFTGEDNRRKVCLAYRRLVDRLSTELLLMAPPTRDLSDEEEIKACPLFYDTSTCT